MFHVILCLKHLYTVFSESTKSNQRLPVMSLSRTIKHIWSPHLRFVNVTTIRHAKPSEKRLIPSGCDSHVYHSCYYVAGAWKDHQHVCEDWAANFSKDSQSRLHRGFRKLEDKGRHVRQWREGAGEEQQRDPSEHHTALPEENEEGRIGWFSAEQ